jgi:single-strand DNA-binding protein
MSKSVNSVTLLGNIGQPPESRTLQNGTSVTTVSMATNERIKRGDTWADHTEWHSVTFFGKLSDVAKQYLHKGSMLLVTGRLRTSSWEDDHQVKRWKTTIIANELILFDKPTNAQPAVPDDAYSEAF